MEAALRGAKLADKFFNRELSRVGSSVVKVLNTPADKPISLPNPFLPTKNARSGGWNRPKYSLRQQADIIKGAKVLQIALPSGPKNPIKPSSFKSHPAGSPLVEKLRLYQKLSSPEQNSAEAIKLPIEWQGEFVGKDSFGLYGRRKLMFKGHKWEKEVKIRRKLTREVVSKIKQSKQNLAWSRRKSRSKPKTKLPF